MTDEQPKPRAGFWTRSPGAATPSSEQAYLLALQAIAAVVEQELIAEERLDAAFLRHGS